MVLQVGPGRGTCPCPLDGRGPARLVLVLAHLMGEDLVVVLVLAHLISNDLVVVLVLT